MRTIGRGRPLTGAAPDFYSGLNEADLPNEIQKALPKGAVNYKIESIKSNEGVYLERATSDTYMTKEELRTFIGQIETIFDIVRLVDASMNVQYSFDGDGTMIAEPYRCYAVWNKSRRCENCISAKALSAKAKMTKFEFVGEDIYLVKSMYVEVDNEPYILEMVTKISDETLFGAYGKNEFVKSISEYNRKLYIDPLTDAYNRRYYEEQLQGLRNVSAAAMLDVDHFKSINDSFGHQAGDLMLRTIVKKIISNIRGTDVVVRYGGDEFLIVFWNISKDAFAAVLERIRKTVHETILPDYPSVCLSVSIGGVYCQGQTADVVREADAMLYQAKETRNCVRLTTAEEKRVL